MTKILCDKCKKEIKGTKVVLKFREGYDLTETQAYDLCSECADAVKNFIADYEITKADEYKKGYEDGLKEGKEEAWMDSMGDNL